MLIRIINGTYGHRPEGTKRVIPKRPGDKPFEVPDEIAKRLVEDKIAVPAQREMQDSVSSPETSAANFPEYSGETKMDELRAIASEFGLSFRVGMTKAEMVALLDEHFAKYEEAETVEVEGEALPALSAQEPE